MSNPSQSLASALHWHQVFGLVGIHPPERRDLPQSVECPVCRNGSMSIMDDPVLHAAWFYCSGCQFADDIIGLVAKLTGCSCEQAVSFLEQQALFQRELSDSDREKYRDEHSEYRRRFNEFWDAARKRPSQYGVMSRAGQRLMHRLRMAETGVYQSWPERAGRFFGIASRQDVENLFFPKSYAEQERSNGGGRTTRRRGGGPGGRRLFQNSTPEEVVTITHFDLPGRIIGLTLIGGAPDQLEVVYKRANIGCCVSRPRESGLAFLNTIPESSSQQFPRVAVILFDAMAATLLHVQHLREHESPLPLLLSNPSPDCHPITLPPDLMDRDLILCGPLVEILPLAKKLNAKVCDDSPIRDISLTGRLHDASRNRFNRIQRRALPWQEALAHQLRQLQSTEADYLWTRMRFTGQEYELLRNSCALAMRPWLDRFNPLRIRDKSIHFREKILVESVRGWTIKSARGDQVVCNLPIRIDRIYRERSGSETYEVTVHSEEHPTTFFVTEQELQRDTLVSIASKILTAQGREPLYCTQGAWARDSFAIARQFSIPEIIHYADRVGWDPVGRRFQFPRFRIEVNGQSHELPIPVEQPDADRPAQRLMQPYSSDPCFYPPWTITLETQIIWALAACVAHDLIAKTCGHQPLGVILDGRYAHETGVTAALALGCGRVDVSRRGNKSIVDYLSTKCGADDFPSVVMMGERTNPRLSRWIDTPQLRHAVAPLSAIQALAISSYPGFVRIQQDAHPQPLCQLARDAESIIPAYLSDFCSRGRTLQGGWNESYPLTVLRDMAEWFRRSGGDPDVVLAARRIIHLDSQLPALAFVELTDLLHRTGHVRFGGAAGQTVVSGRSPVVLEHQQVDDQPAVVRIKIDIINDVLQKMAAPAVYSRGVQTDLCSQSAWRGSDDTESGADWLIDAAWWDQQIKLIHRKRSRRLLPPARNSGKEAMKSALPQDPGATILSE